MLELFIGLIPQSGIGNSIKLLEKTQGLFSYKIYLYVTISHMESKGKLIGSHKYKSVTMPRSMFISNNIKHNGVSLVLY